MFFLCHPYFSKTCLVSLYEVFHIVHSKLLSSFLQILLAHVVFAVANNSAVLIRLSIANQNVILVYIMLVLANFKILGFIFVFSMRYLSFHQL